MSAPRTALVVSDPHRAELRAGGVPPQMLVLRSMFAEPPRGAGAARLGERLRAAFGEVELVAYAWHLVTHTTHDGVRSLGRRKPEGAPEAFGGLAATPEVRNAWAATVASASALGAQTIVLRTGMSLDPGSRSRDRLRAFFETHHQKPLAIVWEPEGLWAPEHAAAFAAELGVQVMTRIERVTGAPPNDAWLEAERASRLLEHLDHTGPFVFSGRRAERELRTFVEAAELDAG